MKKPSGIGLHPEDAVDMGPVRDIAALARAIGVLPDESTVYLEENNMAKEVREVVERFAVESSTTVQRGTIWPKPRIYHVPAGPEFLAALEDLAESHAIPEIGDHLVVYTGGQVLLAAYDLGGRVYVSRSLSPEVLAEVRARIAAP
jgi:hypothetical protein